MEENIRIEWDMTVEEALEINKIHKSGMKNWEELTLEYMEEHNIPITNTPDKHKEYFRRLVGRLSKEAAPESLQDRLFNVLTRPDDDEITIQKIHEITKVSKDDFTLVGRMNTSVWGAMGVKEFETAYRNGALKLQWEVKNYLFDEERFHESLKDIEPIYVPQADTNKYTPTMLVIPPFDAHMGVATKEDYEEQIAKYVHIIRMYRRKVITIVLGQDYLHTNDAKGHTANLTFIGPVDFNKMLEDSISIAKTLVGEALAYADEVNVIYSKGNHDESLTNAAMRAVKEAYPQANYDFGMEEYKAIGFGNCGIGLTHGENIPKSRAGKQRLHDYFQNTFPDLFRVEKKRYVLTGHYHNLQLTDEAGTLIYTLSTMVPIDSYHDKKAFVAAHKNFNAFEFDEDGLFMHYHIQ